MDVKCVTLLFTVILFSTLNENFGLENSRYGEISGSVLKKGTQNQNTKKDSLAETFVDLKWKKLAEAIQPTSVKIPNREISYADKYDCLDETEINAHFGDVLKKTSTSSNRKITLEIESKLEITQPMLTDYIFRMKNKHDPELPVDFCFYFPGKNVVKLRFKTSDFSKNQAIINKNTKCLVIIDNLQVTELTTPVFEGCKDKITKAEHAKVMAYWNQNKAAFLELLSLGLLRGVKDMVDTTTNFWVCLSEDFKNKVKEKPWESCEHVFQGWA